MSRSAIDYLRHILDETRYLQAQVAQLDKNAFLQNETLKRAFVRSLEIIGEAAKQIPPI
ncbi:MAG: HepT-like ribonuclease domain-containing protein [Candidatus Promineifilaceae bacterium]